MRKIGYFIAVTVLGCVLSSQGFALTATPTNSPTLTKTPTQTPTITPTLAGIPTPENGSGTHSGECGPSHLCSLKYVSVSATWASCSSNITTADVTIPGIQIGDLILPFTPPGGNPDLVSARVGANNTVSLYGRCSADPGAETQYFIWWDRTDPRGAQFDTPPNVTLP